MVLSLEGCRMIVLSVEVEGPSKVVSVSTQFKSSFWLSNSRHWLLASPELIFSHKMGVCRIVLSTAPCTPVQYWRRIRMRAVCVAYVDDSGLDWCLAVSGLRGEKRNSPTDTKI